MSVENGLSFAEMIAAQEAKKKAPSINKNNETQTEIASDEKKSLRFYKESWWRQVREKLTSKELVDLRRKHLDYLHGFYLPTDKEKELMKADKGFYTSSIYLKNRAQELEAFVENHENIYQPKTREVLPRLLPYAERIQQHASELLAIANEQDWKNDREKVISDLVEFLTRMFDLGQEPKIVKLSFLGKKDGYYDESEDELGYRRVLRSRIFPLVNRLGTLAHEVWHKHQFKANILDYQENYQYYISDEIDYDAYREQLVEKEAFMIEGIVTYIFRMAYLQTRPDLQADLAQKYLEWDHKYHLEDDYSQLDDLWLCAANDIVQGREKIEDWGGYVY